MKKKIIIAILFIIPFISILLAVLFRGVILPTNEEIIKSLKDINYYEAKVEYIIKNNRGEERESTTQYYSKDEGVRVEFGEEIIKIFKNDGIRVMNNISKEDYVINNSMDILHPLAFMNKILSSPVESNSLKEGQEEWGDTIYIQLDVQLFLNNYHLDEARIFIDKEKKVPIGIVIFDEDGNDTVRIIYKEFKKLKKMDSGLL